LRKFALLAVEREYAKDHAKIRLGETIFRVNLERSGVKQEDGGERFQECGIV
jgi:hypothetical protein